MINPITYLGYVKRGDITIDISKAPHVKNGRNEYELMKFNQVEEMIKRAMIFCKKTLVYFPTVALINRCKEYLDARDIDEHVAIYHGNLTKNEKQCNYQAFLAKEMPVMLATKAFGMEIDIEDIEVVYYFAPTGNVCDYVQEIGRAARKNTLTGIAKYDYVKTDFKHINKLHGLSAI